MHPPLCLPASPVPNIFHSESHLKHISNNPSQNSHLLANCAEYLRVLQLALLPGRLGCCQSSRLPAGQGVSKAHSIPGISPVGSGSLPQGKGFGMGVFYLLCPWPGPRGLPKGWERSGAGLSSGSPCVCQQDGQAEPCLVPAPCPSSK